MSEYSVTVAETSKELTKKQLIQIKDTSDNIRLNAECENGNTVIIDFDFYAVLNIHNENTADKDYKNYVIVDKDGTKYSTGSESFWRSFMQIYDDCADLAADGEEWKLKVFKKPSRNRSGKDFLTCAII